MITVFKDKKIDNQIVDINGVDITVFKHNPMIYLFNEVIGVAKNIYLKGDYFIVETDIEIEFGDCDLDYGINIRQVIDNVITKCELITINIPIHLKTFIKT